MKKNLFLAALAGVALVGCAKNEVAQVTDDSQREISFAAPVVTPVTKAGYYTTENLGTGTVSFNVFGWYCEGSGTFDPSSAVPYMGTGTADEIKSPVTVSYNSGNKDDVNTGTTGYWAPTTSYYWPKNGKLTFSAYAPAFASSHGKLSDNRATGLMFTNYQVQDIDDQYDLLYSLRTFDRTSSTEGTNIDDIYDGVELTFCHALSAIEPIKVYTKNGAGIRIKEINLKNVYNTGSFSQNMISGHDDTNTARAWTPGSNEVDYCLFKAANEAEYYTVSNASSPVTNCKNAIVMPQALNHSTNKVTIEVKYQIQHGLAYLDQVFTQELNGLYDTSSNVVASWNIGMRYTYTLVFDLNDIYFAPQVEVWKDVTMADITIK